MSYVLLLQLVVSCRTFLDVLKDKEQLRYFRHFLLMQGVDAEAPLEFWVAMEDLKRTKKNKGLFKSKLKRIKDRLSTENFQKSK